MFDLFGEVLAAFGSIGATMLPLVLALALVAWLIVLVARKAGVVKDGDGARKLLWAVVAILAAVFYTFRGSIPLPDMFFSGDMLLLALQVALTAILGVVGSGSWYEIVRWILDYVNKYREEKRIPG